MPSRREFLVTAGWGGCCVRGGRRSGASGSGAGVAPNANAASGAADRLGPVGVGLFTLPKSLEKDFDGTLGMLSGLGYKEVELFGPYPFSTEAAKAGWAEASETLGFSGSGFFGHTARQVRESLDRHGLTCPSMHVDLDNLARSNGAGRRGGARSRMALRRHCVHPGGSSAHPRRLPPHGR